MPIGPSVIDTHDQRMPGVLPHHPHYRAKGQREVRRADLALVIVALSIRGEIAIQGGVVVACLSVEHFDRAQRGVASIEGMVATLARSSGSPFNAADWSYTKQVLRLLQARAHAESEYDTGPSPAPTPGAHCGIP